MVVVRSKNDSPDNAKAPVKQEILQSMRGRKRGTEREKKWTGFSWNALGVWGWKCFLHIVETLRACGCVCLSSFLPVCLTFCQCTRVRERGSERERSTIIKMKITTKKYPLQSRYCNENSTVTFGPWSDEPGSSKTITQFTEKQPILQHTYIVKNHMSLYTKKNLQKTWCDRTFWSWPEILSTSTPRVGITRITAVLKMAPKSNSLPSRREAQLAQNSVSKVTCLDVSIKQCLRHDTVCCILYAIHFSIPSSLDSLLGRAPDSWSKGCEFESGKSGGIIFFSRVNFVCWLILGVRSIPVLPQWHVKDPGHSA